jgi:AsmA protein
MATALKWTGGLVLALLVALALFLAFGLHLLKGPITRAVTEATGRELVIEGDLRTMWSWFHPRFRAEGISFANTEWAAEDYLVRADAVEAELRLLPLLRGRVVVPEVHLEGAEVNLERDEEGRRNWILDPKREEQKKESRLFILRLSVDRGQLAYSDALLDIDVQADLNTDQTGLVFATTGRYQGREFGGSGHAGNVLSLYDEATPFPLKAQARIGQTRMSVDGSVTGLMALANVDTKVSLSGQSLSELYDIVGIALPQTPRYATEGRLVRDGKVFRYEKFTGKVGTSDLAGTLEVDTGGKRPFMRGELQSKVIDLGDLGVVVGTEQPRKDGVLPDAPFDPSRWGSVNADVRIKAGSIRRPKQLPVENLATRIQMRDRVLSLDPLEFGVAGGRIVGPVKLDGTRDTIRADVRMQVRKLQLAQLFPTIKENQASVGDIGGLLELTGSGNSVGGMLGSSNGKLGFFMDGGKISAFMMQLIALDLWNAARVKLEGDRQVQIRCAVADFSVKDGIAGTNAFVFDTDVVLIEGGGAINLKTEEIDFTLNPKPKDSSLASLNSPIHLRGTFSDPKPSPDVPRLAAKGVGAVVMGIVNPLLAVLPLLKEGKDQDSPCNKLIAEATQSKKATEASSGRSAASGATAKRPPSK